MAKSYYFVGVAGGMPIETFHPEMYQNPLDWKQVSKAEYIKARKAYSIKQIGARIVPKQDIYVSVKHCSASGMSRIIQVLIVEGKEITDISQWVAAALGWKFSDKYNGVVVSGCGMDMGFHLVHSLGCTIWPNGTRPAHGMRNGAPDCDGGYALKHVWL